MNVADAATKPAEVVQRRPAETVGGVSGVIAALLGKAFDLDADTVIYLAILVGFIPAAVTWLVNLRRGR